MRKSKRRLDIRAILRDNVLRTELLKKASDFISNFERDVEEYGRTNKGESVMTKITQKEMAEQISRYIQGIRNDRKKQYAIAYYRFKCGQRPAPHEKDFGLGYMGAQAVRMRINAIWELWA